MLSSIQMPGTPKASIPWTGASVVPFAQVPRAIAPAKLADSAKDKISTPVLPVSAATVASKLSDESVDDDIERKRRSSAASARFRQKKKMREKELEETAKEMTTKCIQFQSRVNELEKEVDYLRRLIVDIQSQSAMALAAAKQQPATTACSHPPSTAGAPSVNACGHAPSVSTCGHTAPASACVHPTPAQQQCNHSEITAASNPSHCNHSASTATTVHACISSAPTQHCSHTIAPACLHSNTTSTGCQQHQPSSNTACGTKRKRSKPACRHRHHVCDESGSDSDREGNGSEEMVQQQQS
jgi:hypothetical protein